MGKYHETGLNDPILRCKDCTILVHREFIHKHGGCHNCGNKRFGPVLTIREEDMKALREGTYNFEIGKYKIDPEFLAQFEEVGSGV